MQATAKRPCAHRDHTQGTPAPAPADRERSTLADVEQFQADIRQILYILGTDAPSPKDCPALLDELRELITTLDALARDLRCPEARTEARTFAVEAARAHAKLVAADHNVVPILEESLQIERLLNAPILGVSPADLRERFRLLTAAHEDLADVPEMGRRIRLRLTDIAAVLDAAGAPTPALCGDPSMKHQPDSERGAALLECALIIAGVALIVAVAVVILGSKIAELTSGVAATLPGANPNKNAPIVAGQLIETTGAQDPGGLNLQGIRINGEAIYDSTNEKRLGDNLGIEIDPLIIDPTDRRGDLER